MCNESGFGDPSSDGAWLGNCLDGPCNQLMLIDGFPSDPALPQCATHRQYRNFHTYFGACAGTRESSPASAIHAHLCDAYVDTAFQQPTQRAPAYRRACATNSVSVLLLMVPSASLDCGPPFSGAIGSRNRIR
jgi:hypothetical protein